jgi:membrane fusion protein (multidrug efflux system)
MNHDQNGSGGGNGNGAGDFWSEASTTSTTGGASELPRDRKADARLDVEKAVDSRIVVDTRGTRVTDDPHPAFPEAPKPKRHWVRWMVIGVVATGILGVGLLWGLPAVRYALNTVSTDDAFVQSHITYASPRVEGLVTEVLVDQDDRVESGELLVKLDREPFDVAVGQAKAALAEAVANVTQSRARVRSQIALARGAYYQRKNAQESLRRQIATLNAEFATLKSNQASVELARNNLNRGNQLLPSGAISKEEVDQRENALKVAVEREKEAWAGLQETRAQLGLPADYKNPLEIPPDLENQQSTVQSAVSQIASSLAELGIRFDPKDADQAKAFGDFLRPSGDKSAGEGLEKVIEDAPAVKVALAAVERSRRQLDNALLQLRWTEIRSEISGYVQDRQTHPGDRVEPGQTLVSIRPNYVWIAANFKETQIDNVRIGMPVDIHVDAYPHRVFQGRVAGFSPGTGLSQSLLPPENATGNYVKVTQRLPVRIELTEPNPADTPLFAGLSVVPYVRFKEEPTGTGAGKRLHSHGNARPADLGTGPAGSQLRNRGDRPEPPRS